MAAQKSRSDWTDVDRASDPERCVRCLDTASGMEGGQAYKRQVLALLDVREGHYVLDVGCGTGDDVRMMAQLVGSTGRVVGVDNSATMIAEAQKRTDGQDLPVEYRIADAHRLDFADNTFDCCRADRAFQHLEDPRRALTEMMRVARSGARIVVVDPDWGTLAVDAPDRNVTRKILNFRCDGIRNGWMGRRLFALFQEVGVAEIAIAPMVLASTNFAVVDQLGDLRQAAEGLAGAGEISATEAASWLDQLERADQAGRFFAAATLFIVAGRKP